MFIASLSLFYNISEDVVRVVAGFLEAVINTALQQAARESGSPQVPRPFILRTKGIRAALNAFRLNPEVISFVCCPEPTCCALHKPDAAGKVPEFCTAPTRIAVCGARLTRPTKSRLGKAYHVPLRQFHTQSVMDEVARLLCRPGFEQALSDAESARASSASSDLEDIWNGTRLSSIPWPSVAEGTEIRLVFGLSVDWFNAHRSGKHGKSWSVGAIYLTILNLPAHLRHRPENMILVGIIPGPSKPRGEAIQNLIKPLIDELVVLWSDGVWIQRTCKYPLGRLCRAALGPLICDLDAVRSIVGMAGVSFKYPCSVCWVTLKDVREWSTDLKSWKWRGKSEHLHHVSAYQNASSHADRDEQFKLVGIRGCELLRLSYWHPLDWVTIDPMHNLLLGVLSNHLTEIFGMKSNSKGRRLPQPASDPDDPGDTSFAYLVFLRDTVQTKELKKLKRKVLLNLSVRLGMFSAEEAARTKSTKDHLADALYRLVRIF